MDDNDKQKNSGCLFFVLGIIRKFLGEQSLPYKKRFLLSKAEISFYHCLSQAISSSQTVMCKCRLEDIIYVPRGTQKYITYRNYIQNGHVDFAICDKANMNVLLAVELDDKSHNSLKQKEKDAKKDTYLKAASVPVLRVPARRTYDINELQEKIRLSIEELQQR